MVSDSSDEQMVEKESWPVTKELAPSAWNSTLKWNDSYFAGAEWLKL